MLEKFERIKLGHFPTPIEHLKNITKYLDGPNIFIKRDDCTGLATGGNKTRKLEFLIPDAIKNKAELIVTVGAVQSNHARQTAAACALMGLKCLIVLEQRLKNPPESYMKSGNVFLDKLFGAEVKVCPKNIDVSEYSETLMKDIKSKSRSISDLQTPKSNFLNKFRKEQTNEIWLKHSQNIAIKLHTYLRKNKLQQKDFRCIQMIALLRLLLMATLRITTILPQVHLQT